MYPAVLKLKSDPTEIREVEHFVKKIAKELHIADDIFPNILISVTEAVNNAIIHGNKRHQDKTVQVVLRKSNNSLTFVVSDQGLGFDHKSIPDPTKAENIQNIGGRGVFLIQQLSDKVIFKNEGRTVEMLFHL